MNTNGQDETEASATMFRMVETLGGKLAAAKKEEQNAETKYISNTNNETLARMYMNNWELSQEAVKSAQRLLSAAETSLANLLQPPQQNGMTNIMDADAATTAPDGKNSDHEGKRQDFACAFNKKCKTLSKIKAALEAIEA
eukprot:scaffold147386_cov47-Attheya_sp.AAC.1